MKRFAIWVAVGVAGVLSAAITALYYSDVFESGLHPDTSKPAVQGDPVDAFLAAHWTDPLPPQGVPPAQFSPIEASLGPEACGQCHVAQYRDWRGSLHSRTVGPGLLWQFGLMGQEAANGCMRCHAPLAEQKALMALEQGWSGAPSSPPPSYVPADLHRGGLVCAACHVRAHGRFGPPGRTPTAERAPHDGFSADAAFADSRFCAVCHQFPESGPRLNGKLLQNAYEEWRNSLPGRAGRTCQSCHMPDRRHLWRGIHDAEMTASALAVTLDLIVLDSERMRAETKVTNTGAGHFFPTYVVPEIVLALRLVDRDGRPRRELARTIIARRASVDLTQEQFDHRIGSGETRTLGGVFRRPAGTGWSVELHMSVSPGAHYERAFQHAIEHTANMTRDVRQLLRAALRQVETARYHVTLARTVVQ